MGNLVTLQCPHCDFQFTGKFGIGKTDLSLQGREFLSEEEKEVGVNFSQYIVDNPDELVRIRAFIRENRPVILKTWEHQPYYCPECGRLHNRFTYQFLYKGGSFEPSFTCMGCGAPLEKVDLKQTLTCPKCRGGRLKTADISKWS